MVLALLSAPARCRPNQPLFPPTQELHEQGVLITYLEHQRERDKIFITFSPGEERPIYTLYTQGPIT
jgi:hypothetical protein